LSPTQRDVPLTRFYHGKRDEQGAAGWSLAQRAMLDALNDSRMGHMILWDEREHGIPDWSQEANDAFDGHAGPWPDIAQWVAPVRTYRSAAQYLVDQYRAEQSYPGFFNADHDSSNPGVQPDPGPGDPNLGDPWGTWTGYFDWNVNTIVDTATRWECELYVTGLSAVGIDNSPVAEITTDFAPRKTQSFNPAAGSPMRWTATDLATGTVVQSGSTFAESEGVVVVAGLVVPRNDLLIDSRMHMKRFTGS
jgi:hypothetical protein